MVLGTDSDDLIGHWGTSRYGLSVVNEFVLRPTTQSSSGYVFYVSRGQLLDIPLKNGCLKSGCSVYHTLPLSQCPAISTENELLGVIQGMPTIDISSLRLDLEPCWDDDPETCCYILRASGVPRLQLSIHSLSRERNENTLDGRVIRVKCSGDRASCPGPASTTQMILHHESYDRCRYLPLDKMIAQGCCRTEVTDVSSKKSARQQPNCWIVRTYDSDIMLMIALACEVAQTYSNYEVTRIVTDCLGTVLMAQRTKPIRPLMIILHQERHKRFMEPQRLGYNQRDDLLMTAATIISEEHNHREVYGAPSAAQHQVEMEICRLMQPLDPDDSDEYCRTVIRQLSYYRPCKGANKGWHYFVLRSLDIPSLIDTNDGTEENRKRLRDSTDLLIRQWQRKNLSRVELAEIRKIVHEIDQAVKKIREPEAQVSDFEDEMEQLGVLLSGDGFNTVEELRQAMEAQRLTNA